MSSQSAWLALVCAASIAAVVAAEPVNPSRPAAPDVPDANRNTPLHLAALRNDESAIDDLLARGADPTASNEAGATKRKGPN